MKSKYTNKYLIADNVFPQLVGTSSYLTSNYVNKGNEGKGKLQLCFKID